jgi:hypothetical protein
VSIQVIGAGYGRTGTMSTKAALGILGLPCYHMDEVPRRKNKGHIDFWFRVAESPAGATHDWQRVFKEYAASVDFPSSCVWREQMQAYPNAKVLLTLHPGGPEGWYKSTTETIYSLMTRWEFKALARLLPRPPKIHTMVRKLVWERTLNNTMDDRAAALRRYQQHIDEVRAAVPADRLLVFSVDQGWQPLCDFLGLPIPQQDFPKVNDTAQIKRMINMLAWGIKLAMALSVGLIGALVYYLIGLS